MKINKEVVEEITKTNAEASVQVENQIARIGQNINKSNDKLQKSIGILTETLIEIVKSKDTAQPITQKQPTQSPTPHQQFTNSWNQMPDLRDFLKDAETNEKQKNKNKTQNQQTQKPTITNEQNEDKNLQKWNDTIKTIQQNSKK